MKRWMLIVLLLPIAALAAPPWEAADELRRGLARVERLLLAGGNNALQPQAGQIARQITESYQAGLAPELAEALPELHRRMTQDLIDLAEAAAAGEVVKVAALRQRLLAALAEAGMERTRDHLLAGELSAARDWLAVREYARTGAGTRATEAMEKVARGETTAAEAWKEVEADLLQTYAGELRRALKEARKVAAAGYVSRTAAWTARAHGLARLLVDNLSERLGGEAPLAQLAALQAAALDGELDGLPARIDEVESILRGYTPVALPAEEAQRLARLLLRLIKLIDFDYNNGVRDGKITIPLEYHEAVVFRDRAEMLAHDLQGTLSTEQARHLLDLLSRMQPIIRDKGDGEQITLLTQKAAQIVKTAFALDDSGPDYRTALQVLPEVLDELRQAVSKGDFDRAEMKRLEAYAFFDPDIEQYLMPRAPTLALSLEHLFWEGESGLSGLQTLIRQKARGDAFGATLAALKSQLAEAENRLTAKAGPLATFIQSLAIMLREGLEAVLVIAALLGVLRSMGMTGYGRWIWGGVLSGVAGSFALWYAAETFLTITTLQRELLEGVTALLAAAVLVYVTHWIFHKTYVVQWVQFVREQVQRSVDRGHMAAVGLVSFFVVFREGFETVLFYQAMLLESPPAWVLGGFITGVAATALIAWLLLKLGRRLPINRFFIATGALLMLLALIFTGFGIRGLQTAGLVTATPVPGFPETPFLQLYLGLFPTWETLLAQLMLLLLFSWGWIAIRRAARQKRDGGNAAPSEV